MKKLLPLLLITSLANFTNAQQIGESNQPMCMGSQDAIYIDLPGVSSSFAEREWRDFVNQYGKAKKVKKGNEWIVEEAQIIEIGGANPLNLYARSDETSNATRHYIWIESAGSYISSSSNPDAYKAAKRMLEDFAHKVKVDMITLELDTQQKAFDNLEKDLQKLKRENENYHKIIEDAKERIAKAEGDIIKNVQDQQLRMQEIDSQRKVLDEVRTRLDSAKAEKS